MHSSLIYQPIQIKLIKKTSELHTEQQLADSFVLIFHLKGDGAISIGTSSLPLQKETLYICPPFETFGIFPRSAKEISICLVRLHTYSYDADQRTLIPNTDWDVFSDLQMMNVQPVENLASRLQQLADVWPASSPLQQMKCSIDVQSLVYDIFSAKTYCQTDTKSAIVKTKEFIKNHADTKITLDQLAQMAGISAKHYSETFKKWYGQSVTEFITETRMTKAKRLMAKANYKLREIANQTGYQDEFYFSRTFKKHTGCSPTSYMKKRQKKKAPNEKGKRGNFSPPISFLLGAPLPPKTQPKKKKIFFPVSPVPPPPTLLKKKRKKKPTPSPPPNPKIFSTLSPPPKKKTPHKKTPYLPSQENWRTHLMLTASYLEEESEVRNWLETYEQQAAAVRKSFRHMQEKRFLFVRLHKQHFYLSHNRSIQDVFFGDLDFASAKPEHTPPEQKISLEMLTNYQPDCLMLLVFKEPETLAYYQQIQETETWQNLTAVRNKQVYHITPDPWCEYSACGHERIIQQTISLLSGNSPS
ncbi:AraC family transcriptional regulator [Bacillus atrophaeus]|nr:AraC family transcriptional regulator [Bacillus atrophaeus]